MGGVQRARRYGEESQEVGVGWRAGLHTLTDMQLVFKNCIFRAMGSH